MWLGRYTLAGKMSLIETIKRKLEDREVEKTSRELDTTKKRQAEETREQARREQCERQAREMIAESAVLEKLAKIKEELQPDGQLSYNGSDSVTFTWFENGTCKILVNANPDQKFLKIGGSVLRNKKWKDRATVDNALANAYINPYLPSNGDGDAFGGGSGR